VCAAADYVSTPQVQFLLPLMQSSLMPLHETNLLRFTERLLRLSVPNVAHWLVMFYLVFHLWLNILGELLMFGDRLFYKVGTRFLISFLFISCFVWFITFFPHFCPP
jgi:hypothetical protein